MKDYDSSIYEKMSVAVDLLVFTIENNRLKCLVVEREEEPFAGMVALPGVFVGIDETLEEATIRGIKEETGLDVVKATYLFSLPNTYLYSGFLVHTLDLFFLCRVKSTKKIEAKDDVSDSFWIPLNQIHPEEFGLDSVREGITRFIQRHQNK